MAETDKDRITRQAGQAVPVAQGPEYGYIGFVPDETPDEHYTVAGQVGGTAKVTDTPTSATDTSVPTASKPELSRRSAR